MELGLGLGPGPGLGRELGRGLGSGHRAYQRVRHGLELLGDVVKVGVEAQQRALVPHLVAVVRRAEDGDQLAW